MRTDWKRSMAVLLGTGVIALTAACGAEVSGAAQGGSAAGAASSQQATTTEDPGTGGSTDPDTSESPDESEPGSDIADPAPSATSAEPTSEDGEPGGDVADPSPTSAEPTAVEPTAAEPTAAEPTSSGSGASAEDYAFTEDYCLLMPESAVKGLEKDESRNKTLTCTYQSPDSAKDLRIVTVTGGSDISYETLDESYNVDLQRVKIDGRDGFTWTNSSKSLYSALFNLPAPEGRQMSIMVIITDDTQSLAEKKKEALAIAAQVSKDGPR